MYLCIWDFRCPSRGLYFKKNGNKRIKSFTIVDWASLVEDRRSITYYCTFVFKNLITWWSKKQNMVVRNNTESEFRAVIQEFRAVIQRMCVLWLRKLLNELRVAVESMIKLYCNNKAAIINIFLNLVHHNITKHVKMNRHLIKEKRPRKNNFYGLC